MMPPMSVPSPPPDDEPVPALFDMVFDSFVVGIPKVRKEVSMLWRHPLSSRDPELVGKNPHDHAITHH